MAHSPVLSRMAIHGHPLHPMLIHFPVAALLGLVATDLAYIFTADYFWARAGLWLAGIGALGGWVSGLVGLVDLTTVPLVRRLVSAWCHAVLAMMLLSLATLNWVLRVEAPDSRILPWGVYITLLTALLIFVTAIFGGRLVYEYAVGVDTEKTAS